MSEQLVMWPDRSSQKRLVGVHEVDVNTLMLAKIDALSKQMEALKYSSNVNMVQGSLPICETSGIDAPSKQMEALKYSSNVNMVQGSLPICETCGVTHPSSECTLLINPPFMEQAAYAQNFQQHPKSTKIREPGTWEKVTGYVGGWEEAVSKLQERSDRTDAAINNIENQIGQLEKILTKRQPSMCPSNTEVNPNEQVNVITTRSGVQLPEIHVRRPGVAKDTKNVQEIPTESDEFEAPKNQEEQEASAKQEIQEKVMPPPVKPYVPPIPFPQRLRKHKMDKQFEKFLEVFKKLHINIPFEDALAQMPSYAKFIKEILSNERRLDEHETVMLTNESNAILQNKLPQKLKDPRSFTIPCTIGSLYFEQALCDLGASINLMPYYIFRELGLREAKATRMSLQLEDRSVKHPRGIVEDLLVKVDKFIFPADFIILDMGEDRDVSLILG
ncbi:uncharacterized protein LOC127788102 [Diospyros lotus]|uniref:uncharacterized protein LOC127788102 n=1 Tax=Diospyros lotus TaxID=55363 RepID=UPI002255E900|nr:uncharacterized protein LOC127788102 [Diospyros lotus]